VRKKHSHLAFYLSILDGHQNCGLEHFLNYFKFEDCSEEHDYINYYLLFKRETTFLAIRRHPNRLFTAVFNNLIIEFDGQYFNFSKNNPLFITNTMIKKFILKLIPLIAESVANEVIRKSKSTINTDNSEDQLLALGTLLSKQQEFGDSMNIHDHEFKIFSQYGDDGIIQFLIKHIQIRNTTFIEFGVENYMESNTRFLMMNNNWSGFVMDGSEAAMKSLGNKPWFWKYELEKKAVFIDKDNINKLMASSKLENIGLLHIDIDGNDYHILSEIDFTKINPSILIMEYNAVFGAERAITVPYDKSFFRTKKHFSNLYFGASLKALTMVANQKGYALIGCNLAGNNAYFVKKGDLPRKLKELSVEEAFVNSKFRESRNQEGQLTYLKGESRFGLIKGMEVLNVETEAIEQL
jgi:hypothetical protein